MSNITPYVRAEPDYGSASQRNRNDALWQDQIKKVATPATATYIVTPKDDFILCSAITTSVTLPLATRGRELHVTKAYIGGALTILLSGTDLIYNNASVILYTQGSSLHFKAIAGGYIIV